VKVLPSIAVLGLVLAVGSCGGGATSAQSTRSSAVQRAQSTHEYPSPRPPAETAVGGAATPAEALRAFANAYINWSADTVAGDMRALAARSVGQARAATQLAAAQTGQDYELQRGGIANSGTVQAIAPLLGSRREQFVVVTRELTTATNTAAYEGLRSTWHLALASVVELAPARWVVSRWQPEN
jgi:hypothetical protein